MSATYQSVGQSPGSNGGSVVIVKPTGLAIGDLMIASIGFEAPPASATPPNGSWTLIRSTASTEGTVKSWSKVADSSDVAATDFTWTVSGGGNNIGAIIRINYATEPVAYDTEGTSTNASVSITPGSVTPGYLYVAVGACNNDELWTEPTGMTERFDDGVSIGGGVALAISTGTSPSFTSIARASTVGFMAVHGFIVPPTPISVNPTATVITAAFSVIAPTVTGSANVTTTAISATFSVQSPTISFPTPDYSNLDKSATSAFTNPDKS